MMGRMRRTAPALLSALALVAICLGCSPITASGAETEPVPPPPCGGLGDPDAQAQARAVLLNMVQAQANLTRFEGTAAAQLRAGHRNVLSTSVDLIIERPNHVCVRWLGITIKPKRGLIFIDPETLVSQDYTLTVLSRPGQAGNDRGAEQEKWIISAVSSPENPVQLSWTLYVDPDTWLIRRAEVAEGTTPAALADEVSIIEADYRQSGYRRWEPDRLRAQGPLVLEELLPGFLARLAMGCSGGGKAISVQLDFK